jgi:hypothetical protein
MVRLHESCRHVESVAIEKIGENQILLTSTNLRNILLWDITGPHRYDVVVTPCHNGEPIHDYRAPRRRASIWMGFFSMAVACSYSD